MSRSDSSPPRGGGGHALRTFLEGAGLDPLAAFVARQRWYAGRGRAAQPLRLVDWAPVDPGETLALALLEVGTDPYYVPIAVRPAGATAPPPDREIARVDGHTLVDAHWEPDFGRGLLRAMTAGRRLPGARGRFTCHWTGDAHPPEDLDLRDGTIRPLSGEQSNTSLRIGPGLIMKSIRRPAAGRSVEFEILHFLTTRTSFAAIPALVGWVDYEPSEGEARTVGLLQAFVENDGDGWTWALGHLARLADALAHEPPPANREAADRRLAELAGDFMGDLRRLGAVTGGLHAALASVPDVEAFRPELITPQDADRWTRAMLDEATTVLDEARGRLAVLPDSARDALVALLRRAPALDRALLSLDALADGATHKLRTHGDYHLGQVLRTSSGFVIIDFEGEPVRSAAERVARRPALRDVAGMLRSFDYAARAAIGGRPPAEAGGLAPWLEAWEGRAREAFQRGYLEAARESPIPVVPASEAAARRACATFEVEKAFYELRYELSHRPDWVAIPAGGISRILKLMGATHD